MLLRNIIKTTTRRSFIKNAKNKLKNDKIINLPTFQPLIINNHCDDNNNNNNSTYVCILYHSMHIFLLQQNFITQ